MSKTKISEYSATANSNTDVGGINIDEGCAPSGINDAIRTLMAQLKNFQTGTGGDSFNGPVGTTTPAAGAFTTLSASGVATFSAGSASAPALTTSGDTNTGVLFPAADTVGITTGGTERVRVDSSGNVGIGVTPSAWQSGRPTLQLGGSVQGTIAYTGTGSPANGLAIWNNAYYGSGGSGTSNYYVNDGTATIVNIGGANAFNIATAASGTAGNVASFTNALTLDSSGNFIVGATSTDSGAKTRVVFGAGQNGVQIKDSNDTSGAAFLIFQNGSNSNFATIARDGTNNSLSIGTVSAITFPATQVASAGANTLDDYEEGSFTLTLSDSAGNNATMGAGNTWRYIKIGRTVTIAGTLVWSSTSALTAGSRIRLTGLPFTSDGSSNAIRSPCAVGSSEPSSFNIVTSAIKFGLDAGASYIWGTNVTGNNVDGSMYKADLGNSGVLYGIFVTYLATA